MELGTQERGPFGMATFADRVKQGEFWRCVMVYQ